MQDPGVGANLLSEETLLVLLWQLNAIKTDA